MFVLGEHSRVAGIARLLFFAGLLLIPLFLGACQQEPAQADEEKVAEADTVAVADTLSAADSTAADSTAAKPAKGGFLARLFNRGKEEEEEEEEPVPVKLGAVQIQDVPLYLSATATLEAEKRADIPAKIDGEIRKILVEEGDLVEEGQVLAILDGKAQRVALEEAEARARASELDLERVQSLHEMGLTSDKELHDATYRCEEGQAQRKAAELRLDYTRIVAPFSGQVCERFVDQGQTVAVGTQIFSLVDAAPLLARIHLPEKEVVRISARQDVVISPDADPAHEAPGKVLRVAPAVDPRTGTVKVTCQVDDDEAELRPGSFVRVKVRTDIHSQVPVIPKTALVPEGAETYVFRAEADTVVKVLVETGYANGSVVEVTKGLGVGDRVVTVGQGGLKTGSRVREIEDNQVILADESDTTGSALR